MSFPRYPDYQQTNLERIDSIPSHWQFVPCRAIVDECVEKNIDARNQEYLSLMANIGVIRYEDKGDVGNKRPDDLAKCKVVRPGNLVINSMNYGIGSYGLSSYSGVCSPVYIVLNPIKSVVTTRFALRVFEEKQFQSWAQSFGNGILAHRSAIGWDDLKNIKIALPPLAEQELLSRFLDHETAKIDTLIHEQKRLIELLKEKRQAVISHAVTKGLDPNVPMKNSGVEWLGEVPAHWRVMKFVHCVRIAEGQVDPTDAAFSTMPLIAPNHVESGTGRLLALETAADQGASSGKYFCRSGDIVYSKIRPALRKACLAEQNSLCSADMYPLRSENGLGNQFLLWFLLSEPFSRLAVLESERVAMPKINRESLNEVQIVVPPPNEQLDIDKKITTTTRKIDELVSIARKTMSILTERRSSLISAAVTGKIDVRSWEKPALNEESCTAEAVSGEITV